LQNCVERAATMTMGSVITEASFPCSQNRCLTRTLHQPMLRDIPVVAAEVVPVSAPDAFDEPILTETAGAAAAYNTPDLPSLDGRIRSHTPAAADSVGPPQNERERLIWAMEKCGWVQAKAARVLGLTARQMGYALQKHQIPIKRF
jgi:Nif-specific regulatory protein